MNALLTIAIITYAVSVLLGLYSCYNINTAPTAVHIPSAIVIHTDSFDYTTGMAMVNINETLKVLCSAQAPLNADFNVAKLDVRYGNKSRIESANTQVNTPSNASAICPTIYRGHIVTITRTDRQRNVHSTVGPLVAASQNHCQLPVRQRFAGRIAGCHRPDTRPARAYCVRSAHDVAHRVHRRRATARARSAAHHAVECQFRLAGW